MEEFGHEAVRHSAGEYVRGVAHVNGLESFWALFKRGYHGTYHRVSPQHLQRYVTEFAGRHNNRGADTTEQMRRMVRGLLGKTLTYCQLTGRAAAACWASAANAAAVAASRASRPVCWPRGCQAGLQTANPVLSKHFPGLKEVPKPPSSHSISVVPGSGKLAAPSGGTGRNHQRELRQPDR